MSTNEPLNQPEPPQPLVEPNHDQPPPGLSPAPPPALTSTPPIRPGKPVGWILLVLLALVLGVVAGDPTRRAKVLGWFGVKSQPPTNQGIAVATAQDRYYCPMHPEYQSTKPGECPICNMTLVKAESPAAEAPKNKLPSGTIHITPAKQQLIGVTYGEVTTEPLTRTLRTVGRVTYDETKISRIQTKIDGWIDKVFVDFTGQLVTKDQPLLSLYSPDLVATQQEYLLALKAKKYLGNSEYREIATSTNSLVDASKKRLQLWDITDNQIKQIEERGEPLKTLTLYAPTSGFVMTRNAYEHQRITPETELYTIVDLSRIWVIADVYEFEMSLIKLGLTATVSFGALPGQIFRGKVTYLNPQLDAATRTLKVRIELPNPSFVIKPEMYADVEFEISYGNQLSIPEEAVLNSGAEQTVFVAQKGGYFEPRKVELGAKVDRRYIVLSGLEAGEKIVTSSTFLIDSESRLKSAIGGMTNPSHAGHGQAVGPADPATPADHSQHQPR